jgi:hypothetical protein
MNGERNSDPQNLATQMVANVEELVAVLKALHFPLDTPEHRLLLVLESGLESYKKDVLKET